MFCCWTIVNQCQKQIQAAKTDKAGGQILNFQ